MNKPTKILVVAPHPDDETLGCGGTLLKHQQEGDEIYWLIITNMHAAHGWDAAKVAQRQVEIDAVSAMYGFKKTIKLDFPTTQLDAIPYGELVAKLAGVIQDIKPAVVYLPNHSDIHTDHKVGFNAVMSCCKDFRASFICRVLMYECLSETEFAPGIKDFAFVPNVFVNTTAHHARKLEILRVFASEVMAAPLPRSIEAVSALARYRGSRIGYDYAEAFCLLYEKNV